jgi:hypothetical protein
MDAVKPSVESASSAVNPRGIGGLIPSNLHGFSIGPLISNDCLGRRGRALGIAGFQIFLAQRSDSGDLPRQQLLQLGMVHIQHFGAFFSLLQFQFAERIFWRGKRKRSRKTKKEDGFHIVEH